MKEDDDSALLRKQKQFLQQMQFDLRQLNRRVIHDRIPDLARDGFVRFAQFVAEARSSYLEVALSLSKLPTGSKEAESALATLKHVREVFEESRDAFAALERAIERGYIDIRA